MKNDLDFVRDTIKNSGVNAPEDMNEAYVAKTLEGVVPQPTAVEQPQRRRRRWTLGISATAAALVMTLALGVVMKTFAIGKPRSLDLPGGLAIKQFTSYSQVRKEVSRLQNEHNSGGVLDYLSGKYAGGDVEYYVEDEFAAEGGAAAANGSSGSSSGSSGSASGSATGGSASGSAQSHSETYEQVEGVNEADIIKTDGRYIYCVDRNSTRGNKIVVFSARGEHSERVAMIDVINHTAATEDEADFNYDAYYGSGPYINEIFLKDNRLIALCNQYNSDYGIGGKTFVQVYDISDIEHITLLDSFSQSGSYDSSRMIGDTLYTVSSYTPYDDRTIPVCGRGSKPEAVPADCIYTLENNDSESFLVVSAYDTLDYSAKTESKSILGGVDDIYCNENHMYIYTTVWEHSDYGSWYVDGETEISSQILKVDLTDGISFAAYTAVPGSIDDQYALDEYNGNLRVATTSFEGWRDTNNLFVLDEELNRIGEVTGFAKNESIKAVRYLGDTAYVITYEQTDPLFVIDLSEPTDPAILGEVKISGFSTMLVPVGEDRLLGIGYHTENEDYTTMEVQEGVKLALFDISDKENPKVLDSRSYVDCYSEVQYNPKALVYNPERGDYIIPLNYEHWGHYDAEIQEYVYDADVSYGGVLNFSVDGGSLTENGYYKTDYNSVDRCVYVGDYIYMTHYEGGPIELDCVPYR